MTGAQKTIKCLATIFAFSLIVAIISVCLGGGRILFGALGLIPSGNVITENLEVISSEVTEISSLEMKLAFTDLEIRTGETFKVETNNPKITFVSENGNVKIREEEQNWVFSSSDRGTLILYLESDESLEAARIETGAGRVRIEKLNTKNLEFKLGASDVLLENLAVSGEAKIDGGAGKIELRSSEINNFTGNLGVGEFSFSGKLLGRNKINSGVGTVNLRLTDSKDNYTIEVDKGIGGVTLNGENLETKKLYGSGENYLDIDGGIGEIKINFD